MNIGETTKAIMVERIGGPKQAPVTTPSPVLVPASVNVAERVLVTA